MVDIEKINKVKAERDNVKVQTILKALDQSARDGSNLMPHILSAVEAYAMLGEIADVMRNVFGLYEG